MPRKRHVGPAKATPPVSEELVHIAIPARYVEHVAALIADLDRQARPAPPPGKARAERAPEPGGDWPIEQLARLATGRTNSHHTVFAVLDFLAQHPDEFFLLAEVSAAIGTPGAGITGAFSGLTRVLKSQFAYDTYGLPMSRVMRRIEDRKEEIHYGLSAAQADRWTTVRRRTSG